MNKSTWRWANWDKPHRCPSCHTSEHRTTVRPWTLGHCRHCGTRWSYGQAGLRLRWWKLAEKVSR